MNRVHWLVALAAAPVLSCSNDVSLNEKGNVEPAVTIQAPADGDGFTVDDSVQFLGQVADGNGLNDVQSVIWESSLDGIFGEPAPDAGGVVRAATTLSVGTHTITLEASDTAGLAASDSITLQIDEVAQVPSAEISAPSDLDQFTIGETIAIIGLVDDPNQDLDTLLATFSYEPQAGGTPVEIWTGSPDAGGLIDADWVGAPVGDWKLVLDVSDDDGNVASDAVAVFIVDPDSIDADNDGSPAAQDCDDNDPDNFPGNDEACDGQDNDCNSVIDDKDLDSDNHVDAACTDYTGALAVDDCDDANSTVFPGATELSDGIDNDCDTVVDDGTDVYDDDGDCFCEGASCSGSVDPTCPALGIGDCDDADRLRNPADVDGDGTSSCLGDCDDLDAALNVDDDDGDGASSCQGDCDDSDPLVGVTDNDGDGASACLGDCDDSDAALNDNDLDNDGFTTCDPVPDCDDLDPAANPGDPDGDGFDSCSQGDCAPLDDTIYPGATEITADGIDQDCDLFDACFADVDNDNFGSTTVIAGSTLQCVGFGEATNSLDCDDTDATAYPGGTELPGDGIDQDCNGVDTCYLDVDNDTYGRATEIEGLDLTCTNMGESAVGTDCDDTAPLVNPGALDTPADGIDQDCDAVDSCFRDADLDGFGSTAVIDGDDLDCTNTAGESANDVDCDDGEATTFPGALEVPGDGIDQDCDLVDDCFRDQDGDTWGTAVVISGSDLTCANLGEAARSGDCDDGVDTTFPGALDVGFDQVDADCDGLDLCWLDSDLDGFGGGTTELTADILCADADHSLIDGDCDDADPNRNPGETEIPADDFDADCDGVDDCFVDADDDDFGIASVFTGTTLDCRGANEARNTADCDDADAGRNPGLVDIPGDGIDQDCDLADDCYRDNDNDTFGSTLIVTATGLSCPADGHSNNNLDCLDTDPTVYTGAPEVINDGIDQDCSAGDECYLDFDTDGYGGTSTVSSTDLDCNDLGESGTSDDCDDGTASTNPGASDFPDMGFVDSDCNDIDGERGNAIFVSLTGSDLSIDCTKNDPCRTIQEGIRRAQTRNAPMVLVEEGTYNEVLALKDGIGVYGGYTQPDWGRDHYSVAETRVIGAEHGIDLQWMTVRARAISSTLQNLVLEGPDASGTGSFSVINGKSSYVIHAVDSDLTVESCEIVGGRGADGDPGTDGTDASASTAPSGSDGVNGGYPGICNDSLAGGFGGRGIHDCDGVDVSGGRGGNGGTADTDCAGYPITHNGAAVDGEDGRDGKGPDVTAGGGGGFAIGTHNGARGASGNTEHGSGGLGGSLVGTILNNDFWYGTKGASGIVGQHGDGGAGGGGGSGIDGINGYGAGGGGGAAGGCRGTIGSGGGAGGGSFGIYSRDGTLLLDDVDVFLGTGGDGASGGDGGAGQPGGTGGLGGIGAPVTIGGGDGADGGDGGDGGNGGAGGGGGGGSAFGVVYYGGTVSQQGVTYLSGVPGQGGLGGNGADSGTDGDDGSDGLVVDIKTCASELSC